MTLAFVALGANLGDAPATVRIAMKQIDMIPRTRVTACSSLYRTAPFEASGPDFINAVVAVDTGLAPQALLDALQRLEQHAGRERPYHHAPRTLDLDLLCHGDTVLHTPRLTLPHPRMLERAFVLVPLAEIAPDRVLPQQLAAVAGQAIERL
jgi:2-amino-4-hydroxy-6-hydroxymethyldihydropteridine diphosphokinase